MAVSRAGSSARASFPVPRLPLRSDAPELLALLEADTDTDRTSAWTRFIEAVTPLILHTARSLPGDRDTVMDRYAFVVDRLQADDFARLRRFRPGGRSHFATWLVVVVRRLCLDQQRERYGRKPEHATSSAGGDERWLLRRRLVDLVGESLEVAETVPAAGDPEQVVRRRQRDRALQAALSTLDSRDRLLLTLRLEDDLPASRVAEILRLPSPFHVYRRVDRVLRQLRESLEQAGVMESSA